MAGGALDGLGDPVKGYVTRGGRMFAKETYVCLRNVLQSVLSLDDPVKSIWDQVWAFNDARRGDSRARLIDRHHRILDAKSDPGEIYRELTREFDEPAYGRTKAPATPAQKERLLNISPHQARSTDLTGEKIQANFSQAPGNGAPIRGLKVITENGWFAARPLGTENIYKAYAESFRRQDHLRRIVDAAQIIVDDATNPGMRR